VSDKAAFQQESGLVCEMCVDDAAICGEKRLRAAGAMALRLYGHGMSANRIHTSKDEATGHSASRTAAGAATAKNPSIVAEGLYNSGFPHGLGLLGIRPMKMDRRTEAAMCFAGGVDPDEPHKGNHLNLYA
jgi:hypothetical protein